MSAYHTLIQLHCASLTELEKLSKLKEHNRQDSLDITNVTISPKLADLDLNYTDSDNCASFINVQGRVVKSERILDNSENFKKQNLFQSSILKTNVSFIFLYGSLENTLKAKIEILKNSCNSQKKILKISKKLENHKIFLISSSRKNLC